jgi:hypothetical protein
MMRSPSESLLHINYLWEEAQALDLNRKSCVVIAQTLKLECQRDQQQKLLGYNVVIKLKGFPQSYIPIQESTIPHLKLLWPRQIPHCFMTQASGSRVRKKTCRFFNNQGTIPHIPNQNNINQKLKGVYHSIISLSGGGAGEFTMLFLYS